MSITHKWTQNDDKLLEKAVAECQPIFEHFAIQNKQYTQLNAWDAVAGRLLPDICVTGAACRRRWKTLEEQSNDAWKKAAEMVDKYERDLAETTFDGVSEILGSLDAVFDRLDKIEKSIQEIKNMWD